MAHDEKCGGGARDRSRKRSRSPETDRTRSRRRAASRSLSRSPARSCASRNERHTPRSSRRRRSRSRSRSPAASSHVRNVTREKDPALVKIAADLPAAQHREELLEALAQHRVVICVGETGSGKSTQIPQYLYEAAAAQQAVNGDEFKCVAITQPRRVATISVAQRVAEEMATDVGGRGAVGYAIRFDDHSSEHTRVKFMTDGILVRECLADPLLRKYSCVMLDEAHERSIHTDILFGLLKQLVERRPDDFRLLVTSATLDHDRFAKFFSLPDVTNSTKTDDDKAEGKASASSSTKTKKTKKTKPVVLKPCPVVKIPGRSFPVDIFHSKQMQIMSKKGPLSTYVRAAVETTLQVHNSEPEGHILVFLTGQQEIEDACKQIRELHRQQQHDGTTVEGMALRILPLYGALQSKMQRSIFDPVPRNVRKVIVATNIAETSLTIDGIRFVIDCGFTKQKVYNPMQQMESLVVVPISKVSAQQRAGRAGRTGPGKCYRLYSKESYAQMMDETIPEIQRANLANTVLYLKLLGIHDVLGFPYLDPPDEDAILDALKQLFILGALDEKGEATPLGKLMSAFPLEPKLSRALIEAILLGCGRDMVKIVSMLSVENIFEQKRKPQQSKYGGRGRDGGGGGGSGGESDDDDHRGNSWETLLLKLKDEGLLSEYGDHLSYLAIFEAFARTRENKEQWCRDRRLRLRALQMAGSIQKQIQDIMDTLSSKDVDNLKAHMANSAGTGSEDVNAKANKRKEASRSDRLCKSVCAGFFMNAARRCTLQTVYRSLNRDEGNDMKLVHFHPQSMLNVVAPPEYCVYQELVVTSKPFMRDVVEVESKWLDEFSRGKEKIAIEQLFALCGRPVPKEREPKEPPRKVASSGASTPGPGASDVTKKQVDANAISAARARFLARKKHA